MPTKPSIDLGTLQQAFTNARKLHATNARALAKAQDAAKRSRLLLEATTAALDDAARNVLANG